MVKQKSSKAKKRAKTPVLRWRMNRISLWRDREGLTQDQAADELLKMGIKRARNIVTRVENGKTMPVIEILEAMCKLYHTDLTSMIDLTPDEAAERHAFDRLHPKKQAEILRMAKAADQDTD